MLNLFARKKYLLDDDIIEWILNGYAWAFEQFDKKVFFNETILVIPDNKHFPGSETSAEGMANLIFNQVKAYAGMAHWPTRLCDMTEPQNQTLKQQPIHISGDLRGKSASASFSVSANLQSPTPQAGVYQSTYPQSTSPQTALTDSAPDAIPDNSQNASILFTYHPQQLKKPEGIIAHFAHGLSHHLASVANAPPPGGDDYFAMAGELTGIFMGFGLMFANSAVVERSGGCGGCGGGQSPVRQVFLSEEETAYSLAVWCRLKNIESNKVTRHLKKHLRGFFKAAIKDCKPRLEIHDYLSQRLSES